MSMANVTGTYYLNQGFIGYGTELLMGSTIGGGSPSVDTFESVAFVMSITPGEMSTNVIQKTHLRSPGAHHEKLMGIRDTGEFACELTWVPTHESQSNAGGGSGSFANGGLLAVQRSRQERNFIIRLSDGSPETDWPFLGGVTKFQPGTLSLEDLVTCAVGITPLSDSTALLP